MISLNKDGQIKKDGFSSVSTSFVEHRRIELLTF